MIEALGQNTFKLSGRIDMQSSNRYLDELSRSIDPNAPATLDLANIDSADSSCIALFLELIRSQQPNAPVTITQTPEFIVTLANLYGVEDILQA